MRLKNGNGQTMKSFICMHLRYLIINNPMNPDALYQDQSDKTPQEVKSNLKIVKPTFGLRQFWFHHLCNIELHRSPDY